MRRIRNPVKPAGRTARPPVVARIGTARHAFRAPFVRDGAAMAGGSISYACWSPWETALAVR
jgi:hypothetical protein